MMNKLILNLVILLCLNQISFSQITGTFTADNSYAVYIGNQNSVLTKVLPSGAANGITNNQHSQIFQPEAKSFVAGAGDYFYLIAWSDDGDCQGLIGEFKGQTTLKTGDAGWQVYATGKNYGDNQAPPATEINTFISAANTNNGWVAPFVGPANANSSQACRGYRKVAGISDDAKWVWFNSTTQNTNSAVFGTGKNHKEFLIFRFPVSIITVPDLKYPACCPPILKEDLASLINFDGNLNSYTPEVILTPAFKQRIQAYVNYRKALDPCLAHFDVQYYIKRPAREPDGFDFAQNTNLSVGATTFRPGQTATTTWGQPTLSNITLQSNKWYRFGISFYGGPENCSEPIQKDCSIWWIDFNLNKVQMKSANASGKTSKVGLNQIATVK
jgi:hypothetical protein